MISPFIRCLLCITLITAFSATGLAQNLIPVSDRHDIIFDGSRNHLLITTDSGTVERFDLGSQTLLSGFNVGVDLSGGDITPDGNFLYVGEEQAGATQSIIRKVDLNDGSRTNLTYTQVSLEAGAWDVVITDNGRAFTTGRFAGSGGVPLREIDLSNDTFTIRDTVRQRTHLHRSSDRSSFLGLESNSSAGPIFTYDAATDSFPEQQNTGTSLSNDIGAASRNGDFYLVQDSILNSSLGVFDILPYSVGGAAFDPFRDIVYVADFQADELIGYDFVGLEELFRVGIGENISSSGAFPPTELAISDDSNFIALTTPDGVRIFENPIAVPEPSAFALLLAGLLVTGARRKKQQF